MRKALKGRIAKAAGTIGAVGVAATLAFAGSAQAAATPQHLTICSGQDFPLRVTFPGRGGLTITTGKVPGKVTCVTHRLRGTTNEQFDVYTGDRYLGSAIYNGQRGAEVRGIPGPSFVVS
ncbi:hypothetical protein GCM10011581_18780 [Saccharopolyspora subtropica]|uniref:Secreted protein n=1 Tax=Saccharopolyspora thermophila TaxID=89367 RepID=A0A917JSC9_9PSEU|nr:hypothetical protein [Saccharopolyspora subtropica]GGI81569.1 hypothetical protein GCM10011581_18780 [Saccharopolyspora subtropica]